MYSDCNGSGQNRSVKPSCLPKPRRCFSFFAAALPAGIFRTGLLTKNRQPKHVFNGSRRRFSFFAAALPADVFRTGLLTKNRQPKHVFNGSRRRFSLSLRIRPLARQTNTHQDKRSTPPASFPGKSDKENPSLPGGGFRPLHGRKPSSSSL